MGQIVVFMNMTLDGVIQAPGRPDEDLRGNFQHGGWAIPYPDPEQGKAVGEGMATAGGILLGRRTYEDLYKVWPNRHDGNPFTEVLNNSPKYVVSTRLQEPLPWMNSTLINKDVPEALTAIKAKMEKDLVVLGSGKLVQFLTKHKLVDSYLLLIHPLVLGTGFRIFPEGSPFTKLQLVASRITGTGVVMGTYRPVA